MGSPASQSASFRRDRQVVAADPVHGRRLVGAQSLPLLCLGPSGHHSAIRRHYAVAHIGAACRHSEAPHPSMSGECWYSKFMLSV